MSLAQNSYGELNIPYNEPSDKEIGEEQKQEKYPKDIDEENDFDSYHWDIISD